MPKYEDLKAQRIALASILLLCLIAWGVDHFTGIFTTWHLDNEEAIALQHRDNTVQIQVLLDELIKDTSSTSSRERKTAAIDLGKLGTDAIPAIPNLRHLLDDDVLEVRTAAAAALKIIETPVAVELPSP